MSAPFHRAVAAAYKLRAGAFSATSVSKEKAGLLALAKAHEDEASAPPPEVALTPAASSGLVKSIAIALASVLVGFGIGQVGDGGGGGTPTTTTVVTTTLPPSTTVVTAPSAAPFAASSPWNTPIPAGTQWFDSAILHAPVSATDTTRHWYVNEGSMRIWHTSPSDPRCTFTLPSFVDATFNRNRPASTFQFGCPALAQPGTDEDHILFIVDDLTGDYVELWQATRTGQTITALGWARGNMRTGTGMGGLVASGGNNAGCRAANFSWAAGLITGSDLAANKIDHALVIALGWGLLSNTDWRNPATAPDNGGHSGPIAMGTRLGIPAGTPRPAGLSPFGNAMFDALVKYGAFVGDFAGTAYPMFYADSGSVAEADPRVRRLFTWWDGWTADMDLIAPLVRVADYQPGG